MSHKHNDFGDELKALLIWIGGVVGLLAFIYGLSSLIELLK